MRWPQQVVHVAWKDARMLRWFAAVGVVVALLAAVRPGESVAGYSVLLLALSGIGAVVVAVQADSPIRGEAFWVSRPLSPSAVLAAKLLVILAVMALAGAAMAGVLLGHNVPMDEYPGQLGFSALFLGTMLATVIAMAAVTRDLRGFGFGWILLVAGWIATGILLGLPLHDPVGRIAWWLVPVVLLGSGLVVATYQYITGRLMVSVLLLVVFALGTAATSSLFDDRHVRKALPVLSANLRPRSIEAAVFDPASGGQLAGPVAVRIAGANPAYKYMLWEATLTASDRPAPRADELLPYAALTQLPPAALGLTGVSWAGQPATPEVSAWVHIGSWLRQIPLPQPVAVHASLVVARGELVGRIPLEVGRSFVSAGYRLQIAKLSNGARGASVVLRISTAGNATNPPESNRNPNFMLLDVGRRLLFVLNGGARSGYGFGPVLNLAGQERHLWPRPAGDIRPPRVGEDRLELIVAETRNIASEKITVPVQQVKGAAPPMLEYADGGRQIYIPLMQ